jgi:DNA polymerase
MLREKDYFITNTVKYRPPGNRTPTWQEVAHSMPYLRAEFKAIGSPNVIVAVGSTAYGAFRPDPGRPGILTSAGVPQPLGRGYLIPMIHPAYGLRNPKIRPLMEEHWDRFGHWFREEYGA